MADMLLVTNSVEYCHQSMLPAEPWKAGRSYSSYIKLLPGSKICRQCKHAVHPIKVPTHLFKKHHITTSQIQPVLVIIQQWTNLIQDPDSVQIPRELDHPLLILPVHINSMQCQRDLN
jgi:hypothetical protein